MKTGMKLFIVAVGLVILGAWTPKQTNDIDKAAWLIGTWENFTERGKIYETWSKESNNGLSGINYSIKNRDTVVFENIQLVQEKNILFYIPIVKNQNDALPVRFANKINTENPLVFENKQHDFPQVIAYTKINADSLVAEISGIRNGQKQKQTFPMKKIN
ncbi:hypothetical protein G3I01_11660 [Gramella sp. MT6]|uniref:DUF6265 family protein n=1 Tax=Gramella sp. MT6 TaxID=2705471 RepID=UPI001C600CCF|nr:DUF6265 family protein [Gramella sp. MT6]QYA26141.1 hypothetical protein G3I01_11660 [Gramella sp. MT6]